MSRITRLCVAARYTWRLSDPEGQSSKPARRVDGLARPLVRHGLNAGSAFEQCLHEESQLHSGQRSAWTAVNARAIEEILTGIAVQSESPRVLKDAAVPVGGDPDE